MKIPFAIEGKTGFVIAARPQHNYSRLFELLEIAGDRLIVCSDGGTKIAGSLNIQYDLFIGDGDSGGQAAGEIESVDLPREKNVTDTHAAVDLLLERGYKKILLCCCTGGRLDHELSNILLLEYIAARGGEGCLLDGQNEIYFVMTPFDAEIGQKLYQYLSIIPLDEVLSGVNMIHFKYPLVEHTVLRGDSLTVSNEPLEGARVQIKHGRALIILSHD